MYGTTRAVFLSYRREETRHIAGRLADRLTERLGSTQVFMDVDTIEPGADFAAAIAREVASCDVLIALIGPIWSTIADPRGRRRLDDPDDFVVLEIQAALEREIRVIPVLVDGAVMPDRYDLPKGLQGLTLRNAVRLDHETFRSDVTTLLDAVERILPTLAQKAAEPTGGTGAYAANRVIDRGLGRSPPKGIRASFRLWIASLVGPTGVDVIAGQPRTGSDGDGWSRHRRLLAGVMAIMLVTSGVLVGVLVSRNTSTSGGSTQGFPAVPTQPGPSSATQVIPRNTPAVPSSPPDTPEQLQRAIKDYYALVPGNLPAAWKRLTANFQQNHSGGFTVYQDFWNSVQRVTVFDVFANQGDTVDATIEYFFIGGRILKERTRYGLVSEDGLWKIDSSTVLSSETKQGS